jgi:hypothetical protein
MNVVRQTFQLARCGCTLRVTSEKSLYVETVVKLQCTIKQFLDDGFVISRIIKVSFRGAPDIISGRISGPDSEIIELSGIRPDISNIRPDTGYFFKAY